MNSKEEIYRVSYFIFKKGVLSSIIAKASQKEGSIRLLARRLGIPKTSLYDYMNEKRSIPLQISTNFVCSQISLFQKKI